LVTLASDDSRNLRRNDEAHCSRFADMFEKNRVALFSLPVRLHDIKLGAADTERRDDARNRSFCLRDVGKSMKGPDGPIERINVGSGSGWIFFSV